MPTRKKPAGKPRCTVEYIHPGHFKVEGVLKKIEEVKITGESSTRRVPVGRSGRKRTVTRVTMKSAGRIGLRTLGRWKPLKFVIPIEVANRMNVGKVYEIQCTVVEKKGSNG